MLEHLEPFSQLKEAKDDVSQMQKFVRRQLHESMNYWDYLIERLSGQHGLHVLRNSTKQDIATIFRNQFL